MEKRKEWNVVTWEDKNKRYPSSKCLLVTADDQQACITLAKAMQDEEYDYVAQADLPGMKWKEGIIADSWEEAQTAALNACYAYTAWKARLLRTLADGLEELVYDRKENES